MQRTFSSSFCTKRIFAVEFSMGFSSGFCSTLQVVSSVQVICFFVFYLCYEWGVGWAFQIRAQSCVKNCQTEASWGKHGALHTTQVVGFSVFYSQSWWMVQQKKLGRTLGGNGPVHFCLKGYSKTKMNRLWS